MACMGGGDIASKFVCLNITLDLKVVLFPFFLFATLFCMVLVNMYTIIAMYFVCSVLICQVSYTGVYFYNRR